jgi:hypothetical protein
MSMRLLGRGSAARPYLLWSEIASKAMRRPQRIFLSGVLVLPFKPSRDSSISAALSQINSYYHRPGISHRDSGDRALMTLRKNKYIADTTCGSFRTWLECKGRERACSHVASSVIIIEMAKTPPGRLWSACPRT